MADNSPATINRNPECIPGDISKDTEHTDSDGRVRLFSARMTATHRLRASSWVSQLPMPARKVSWSPVTIAAGEYVSVSSQADTERADMDLERRELAADPEYEHAEMTAIYVGRTLDAELAAEVATQRMAPYALNEAGLEPGFRREKA